MKHKDNHTYMRDKKNHYRERKEIKEESLKKENERKVKNEEQYGKYPNLIIIGEKDRISGNHLQQIEDEAMKISYSYGYYQRGSRVLEGFFANEIFSVEKQREFGMLDLTNGVPEKYIKNLKEYPAYIEGRIYQIGRNAYDFAYENNLEYDDYIFMMELMYPEIKSPIFKEGYKAREHECSKIKQK